MPGLNPITAGYQLPLNVAPYRRARVATPTRAFRLLLTLITIRSTNHWNPLFQPVIPRFDRRLQIRFQRRVVHHNSDKT